MGAEPVLQKGEKARLLNGKALSTPCFGFLSSCPEGLPQLLAQMDLHGPVEAGRLLLIYTWLWVVPLSWNHRTIQVGKSL